MISLSKIKSNPNNPRLIKDDKFYKLVESLKTFGEKMMPLRPIVIDEDGIILGGNMRFKALKELKYTKVPKDWIKQVNDLTEQQKQEFIIKDNVGFGAWDWDMLANEWDVELLADWGLEVYIPEDIDLDDFFEEAEDEEKDNVKKIILEYTEEEYEILMDNFKQIGGSKEKIIYNLLVG